MEPKFQSSFIPKKPLVSTTGVAVPYRESKNIFSTIASILLVVTLFVTVGTYFYKNILKNQIIAADKELNDAREAFQTQKIEELLNTSSRFRAVRGLLEKHVVASEVFSLLQGYTVKKIRFDTFKYENKGGVATLSMSAEAQSYNAIVEQSRLFAETGFFQNYVFSDFVLGQNGNVNVKLNATLSPKLVSYKEAVEATVSESL